MRTPTFLLQIQFLREISDEFFYAKLDFFTPLLKLPKSGQTLGQKCVWPLPGTFEQNTLGKTTVTNKRPPCIADDDVQITYNTNLIQP